MIITTGKDLETFLITIRAKNPYLDAELKADIDTLDLGYIEATLKEIEKNTPLFSSFHGTLNGSGHTIRLKPYIYRSDTEEPPLSFDESDDAVAISSFGLIRVNSGTIRDLTVKGTITDRRNHIGSIYTAGIVGSNYGDIINCCSYVDIIADMAVTGGIAGKNSESGNISSCQNYGLLDGAASVGGIVGFNKGCVVCCENYGQMGRRSRLTARGATGRIAGIAGVNTGCVRECTNNADVIYSRNTLDTREARFTDHKPSQIIGTDWSKGKAEYKYNHEKGRILFPNNNSLAGQMLEQILLLSDYDEAVLMRDPNPQHRNNRNQTYLHIVCSNFSVSSHPDLFAKIASDIFTHSELNGHELDDAGKEAIEYIADTNSREVLKMLIQEANYDKDEKDTNFSDIGF